MGLLSSLHVLEFFFLLSRFYLLYTRLVSKRSPIPLFKTAWIISIILLFSNSVCPMYACHDFYRQIILVHRVFERRISPSLKHSDWTKFKPSPTTRLSDDSMSTNYLYPRCLSYNKVTDQSDVYKKKLFIVLFSVILHKSLY